ncbi:MAG: AraC family transcriptional regulator [Ktedonobacteraceae bacterium]|nr:AraC family transcriptional regulator [Ktedonobacteraceae bacterium]
MESKYMIFAFDERPSDSPFIETIWRTQSERPGTFISRAVSHWEMVVTKQNGRITVCVRGPETKATLAHCPEHAEFFGIQFKLGTFMPQLPTGNLLDGDITLPEATTRSFWLLGSAWQLPDYENAETFVNRLVRDSLLVREPVVGAALQGQLKELSLRSIQRRFLRATGLTQGAVRQIERAREAEALLEQGVSILDTVDQTGYADQSHMTRSLKHLIGRTPAQIIGTRTN